jgi:2-oxoisovalerate dehydrogenase E1 component
MLLRECVRLAREEQRVAVFIEPIALYATRDLHAEKDGGWMSHYPGPCQTLPFGSVGRRGTGADLAIVTYGNGYLLSRKAEPALRAAGLDLRIIDLRWLAPLPEAALLDAVAGCATVLIVDECRRSAGPAEALMALLAETGYRRTARLTAEDSFIATGPAYAATLPSTAGIVEAALALVGLRRAG